ncbi:helix-turn-helix domain-containing protein [Deinococcus sp. HMF7604]|uniref:helix-turn-helix domain-containing protein n=1 Tax=Deinococcus betulae TaxID=2873312 RepID=UPI001CCA1CDF|nr:helix-turn-helix domain-containing protein [Deinococcus betulae]MBZ9753216.1 helix-turn-helix domain-containing protein [Deinococcus betulae]
MSRPHPIPRVTLCEIAAEFGLTPSAVHKKAESLGLVLRPQVVLNRRHQTVSAEDAERLRAGYAAFGDTTGWLTGQEAARLLGCCWEVFLRRRKRGEYVIERRRVPGSLGAAWRYHPGQVAAYAAGRPVALDRAPAGTLSTPQLTVRLGVSKNALHNWRKDGLKAGQTKRGYWYWRESDVLAYLTGPLRGLKNPVHQETRYQALARLKAPEQVAA